jgi:hypothetical protein
MAAALFVSLALRRPLLAIRTNNPTSATRLTIGWAFALVAIAAIQLGGSLLGMASITSPGGLVARTGVGLAAEAVMLIATKTYLRSQPSEPPSHPLIEPESSHDPKQRAASSLSNPGRP